MNSTTIPYVITSGGPRINAIRINMAYSHLLAHIAKLVAATSAYRGARSSTAFYLERKTGIATINRAADAKRSKALRAS